MDRIIFILAALFLSSLIVGLDCGGPDNNRCDCHEGKNTRSGDKPCTVQHCYPKAPVDSGQCTCELDCGDSTVKVTYSDCG